LPSQAGEKAPPKTGNPPQINLPLKFVLPHEELKLIRKKKELQIAQAELKLESLKMQQIILQNNLQMLQTLTNLKLETIKKLSNLYAEKIKELQIAGMKAYARVGDVVITPNLAIKSGEEVGQGLKLQVSDKGIFLEDEKTKTKLIVPVFTTNPKEFVENITNQIEKGKKFEEVYQLTSGETFQTFSTPNPSVNVNVSK
jgi:hypothetical protein